ncbi:hypothetical protein I3W98_13255, partial [Streptomyces cavourensis]|nr:hypothetical protein [Streptomyces cavourensis]
CGGVDPARPGAGTRAALRGGNHESLNPYLIGGLAFLALMFLLWVTTRFNRDR